MVTINDVAKAANLSVTTVSRALNNYDDVAEATRAHVTRIAEQLGYHPSHAARSLQGTRTNTLGLVIPQLVHRYMDSFWLEFIGGVGAACADAGFDLLLSTGKDLHAEHACYQRMVRSRRVDGVILCDLRVRDPRITYLQESKAAFVAFGRTLSQDAFSWVDVDGAAGVCQGMEHLLALGHRRIALLGTQRAFSFSHFRHEGYSQALLDAGLPEDETLVMQDLDVHTDFDSLIDRLLAQPTPPTAVLACADFLASGAVRALRRRGLRVPEDISLVAFDDTLVTQHTDPPLTCIRQENEVIGGLVAGTLIAQLGDRALPPTHRLQPPTLVQRRSTAPLNGD